MTIFGMIHTAPSTQYTEVALRTFFQNTLLKPEDRFLLVDNDNSVLTAFEEYPRVELIHNPVPAGFSKNMNGILRCALEAQQEAVLLNNDLVFTERWFEPMQQNRLTIASPLTNREVQYVAAISVVKTSQVSRMFRTDMTMSLNNLRGYEHTFAAMAEAHRESSTGMHYVLTFPFCCVRIPLAAIEQVGGFDVSFGNGGGEDYDYCLRAILAGFSVEYALGSYVLHFGGKSSWAGVESDEERRTREGHFRNVFQEKWGEQLSNLILYEQAEVLHQVPRYQELVAARRLDEVIRSLCSSPPAMKVPLE